MNKLKRVLRIIFNFNTIITAIMGILAVITLNIAVSVIFLDIVFSWIVSIPFIVILLAYLASEVRLLILKNRLDLLQRNRAMSEDNQETIINNYNHIDTMNNLMELHAQMLDALNVMEEMNARKRRHPDDVIIKTIDDLYE